MVKNCLEIISVKVICVAAIVMASALHMPAVVAWFGVVKFCVMASV
jgi:hypothetical protein